MILSRDTQPLGHTQDDDRFISSIQNGSERLAMALGLRWPCGHHRDIITTHTIGGVGTCKVCRRKRWMKGFNAVVTHKRVCAIASLIRDRVSEKEGPNGWERRATELRRISERNLHRPANGRLPLDELKQGIAAEFKIPVSVFTDRSRIGPHVAMRSVLAKILHDRDISYPAIGRVLGGRDHSTIINSVRLFEYYCKRHTHTEAAYLKYKDQEAVCG